MRLIKIRDGMMYDKRVYFQVYGKANFNTHIYIEWNGFELHNIMKMVKEAFGYRNIKYIKCLKEPNYAHLEMKSKADKVWKKLVIYVKDKIEKRDGYIAEFYQEIKEGEK